MQISIICGDMYQWSMIEWIQGLWVPLFGHLGPPTAGRRQAVLLAECQSSSPWPQERARHRGLAGLQHIDSLGLAEKLKHMEEICWERTTIVMFFSTTIWEYLRCFFMKIRSAKPVCPHSSLQTARSFRSQSKHARTSPKCNWESTATRYGYDSYMTHITVSIWLGYDSYDMTHIHCFSNSCWMLWSTPAWCRLRAPWLELHRLWKSARAETQKKRCDRPFSTAQDLSQTMSQSLIDPTSQPKAQKLGSEMFGALEDVQSGKQNLEGKLELFCLQGYR